MKILINLKTYKYGKESLNLVKKIEKFNKDIIVGVQPTEIFQISKSTKLEVFSQHTDFFVPERFTGYVIPEAVKSAGAKGVFLNHSEHRLSFDVIKKTTTRCKKIGLKVAVFVDSLNLAKKVDKLKPDYLVYEPAELVGGKISVSETKPSVIHKISKVVKNPFLVGAGIKTKKDIDKSIELGAKGVAFSSAITLAKNPEKKLKQLFN